MAAPVPPLTIQDLITSWGEEAWPLEHSDFSGCQSLAEAITKGTAHGVCDGSYMPELDATIGTAGWKAEDSEFPGGSCCRGATPTSGTSNEINAYRSEFQGIHAILLALTAVCEFFRVTSGYFWLGCDCLWALRLAQKKGPVPIHLCHGDLICTANIIHAGQRTIDGEIDVLVTESGILAR